MTSSTRLIRIAVVEDITAVRREIVKALKARSEWEVVAECASAAEARREVPRAAPDVVLLDVGLETESAGLDLIVPLRKALPDVVVVMLTVANRPSVLARAIRLGACGYLVKQDKPGLVAAVEDVLAGGAPVMSPSVARHLWTFARKDLSGTDRKDYRLTRREWGVLRLTMEAKHRKEIAEELGITVDTVKTHCRNIFQKLSKESTVPVDSTLRALLHIRGDSGFLSGE